MKKFNRHLKSDWYRVGDGSKLPHDPLIGDKRMKGLWTINWDHDSHQGYSKINKLKELRTDVQKEKVTYREFYSDVMNTDNKETLNESWKGAVAAGMLGLSSFSGDSHATQTYTQSSKEASKDDLVSDSSTSILDTSFIDYIKSTENSIKRGWDNKNKVWRPFKSLEGGKPTIAYGHKLINEDDNTIRKYTINGITEEEAVKLLKQDILNARKKVYSDITSNSKFKHLYVRYLTKQQEEMLVDFAFNLGTINKFPKFVEALLTNNVKDMMDEYKRFGIIDGKKSELKDRNSQFKKRFFDAGIIINKT